MGRKRLAAWILTLALACAGCRGEIAEVTPTPQPTPTPVEKKEFALARTQSTLHPILGSDQTNLTLAPLIWEGLFALDQSFTPQPVLCQSYGVSQDGLTWTFTIRGGVTFSDGTSLTAGDVASSLQMARGAGSRFAGRLSQVQSVSAQDEKTLTIALSTPNGGLPALLDIPVVRGEGETPLGTGPYRLEEQGEEGRLVARTDWWRGLPLPLEQIPLKGVGGADELIHAFDTREVGLVTTDLTGTNSLGYSEGYEVWDCPSTTMLYVGFQTRSGPCQDPAVRRALMRGLDRNTVANTLYAHHAQASALPAPPSSPLYDQELAQDLEYAPQTMEELLLQAGYAKEGGVFVKAGTSLRLELAVNADSAFKTNTARYLAQTLTQIGVEVEVQALSWTEYLSALEKGDFDLYLGETQLTADFDLSFLVGQGGSMNYGGYGDESVQSLLAAFRGTQEGGRTQAARALYQALAQSAPIAPLCFKTGAVLTQWGQVAGLTPTKQDAFYGFAWSLTE